MRQSIEATLERAREILARGDAPESYRVLKSVFGGVPDRLEERSLFCQAVGLLAQVSRALGAEEFVHTSSRTEPFPFAPDFTTLLYQHITNPWTGGALRVDPATQEVGPVPPDDRPDEVLAEEILVSCPEDSHSSPELISQVMGAFRQLPEHRQIGCYRNQGRRLLQRRGGPVLSNHF
jgi:hypothetical protein